MIVKFIIISRHLYTRLRYGENLWRLFKHDKIIKFSANITQTLYPNSIMQSKYLILTRTTDAM